MEYLVPRLGLVALAGPDKRRNRTLAGLKHFVLAGLDQVGRVGK
ncbi:MAG: hypothetical protein AB7Q01_08495 [Gammaproteobacteria bacterium]